MHIGYILTTFPALSETFVLNEILELERQGVTVTVFSLREPRAEPRHESLSRLRGKIVYLGKGDSARAGLAALVAGMKLYVSAALCGQFSEFRNISRGLQVGVAARRHRVDALHAHFADRPASLAYWAHRMTGLPFSFTAHAIDIYDHGLRDNLMDTKLRAARFVITVCEYNKQFMLEHFSGAKADKIHVINNSVDPSYFVFRERDVSSRMVLAVGRLVAKKGFDLLIRAMAELRSRGIACRVTIVGDGPERGPLTKLVTELQLADVVTLAGAKSHDDVVALMRETCLFCMPFRRTPTGDQDSLSLVLIEAMASGVPVVSTRLGAIPEIVDDGVNGLLVEPEDVTRLAEVIALLLESPELRQKFARAGRAKVEQRFSLPANVGRVRELFSSY